MKTTKFTIGADKGIANVPERAGPGTVSFACNVAMAEGQGARSRRASRTIKKGEATFDRLPTDNGPSLVARVGLEYLTESDGVIANYTLTGPHKFARDYTRGSAEMNVRLYDAADANEDPQSLVLQLNKFGHYTKWKTAAPTIPPATETIRRYSVEGLPDLSDATRYEHDTNRKFLHENARGESALNIRYWANQTGYWAADWGGPTAHIWIKSRYYRTRGSFSKTSTKHFKYTFTPGIEVRYSIDGRIEYAALHVPHNTSPHAATATTVNLIKAMFNKAPTTSDEKDGFTQVNPSGATILDVTYDSVNNTIAIGHNGNPSFVILGMKPMGFVYNRGYNDAPAKFYASNEPTKLTAHGAYTATSQILTSVHNEHIQLTDGTRWTNTNTAAGLNAPVWIQSTDTSDYATQRISNFVGIQYDPNTKVSTAIDVSMRAPTTGNEATNPHPLFWDNTPLAIGSIGGRTYIVSAAGIDFSQVGDQLNFYRTDLTNVLEGDPFRVVKQLGTDINVVETENTLFIRAGRAVHRVSFSGNVRAASANVTKLNETVDSNIVVSGNEVYYLRRQATGYHLRAEISTKSQTHAN